MTLFLAAIIFILGISIGSFLSVIIHRTQTKQKGIVLSRSFCPECKKKLKWRHLIPVFSWIMLRGKCAYCGKSISFHYIALELLTGLLFVTTFFTWNFLEAIPSTVDPTLFNYAINWHIFEVFIFYIIEFSLLLAIFFYDLLHKEIPDRFSLPAIALAILGGVIFGEPSGMNMLIGGIAIFAFFGLQFMVSKGKWIGGGDLRLGLLLGVLLGLEKAILAVVMAYLIGSIISIILLLQKKLSRKSQIPFGPFLITGAFIAIFYGNEIINWYLNLISLT